MIIKPGCVRQFHVCIVLPILPLIACFSVSSLAAGRITGSVRNQSRGVPVSGEEVILFCLERGKPEEARAKTDSQGAFAFAPQYPEKAYLVRVIHQGVSYDQQASPGQPLSVEVFDADPEVRGITGTIEILRAGTNGKQLHVSDLVEIKNASSPPLTLAGDRTFEVHLPPTARLDSVLAAGPDKIVVTISASPVSGQPGHFTVKFPLRPGATKIAFNYDLPYNGRASFHTGLALPLRQLAVMIPPTMKFSSVSPGFTLLATANNQYQVHVLNQLRAGEGREFEISGVGPLPPVAAPAQTLPRALSPALDSPGQSASGRAALRSLASLDSRLRQTQPPSQSAVLGGVTFFLFTACAILVWRAHRARNISAAQKLSPPARQRQRSAA
jgi:hypothetical protein